MLPLPGHRLVGEQRGEKIELFLEKLFILRQLEAEQREGFGEGATTENTSRGRSMQASTLEKRWKTRIGSSELRTVTADPR